MALIIARNLTKIYTRKNSPIETKALDKISLTVDEGEFVAIAGPSGSGKTTLLNCLGALDTPTEGEVHIGGIALASLSTSQLADLRLKRLGFVFQAYNLIPTLTALENTEYVALLQGMKKRLRKRKAQQILNDLGLGTCLERKPHELSGGQQQRVAVARSLLAQPKIILADEPTANLDSSTGAGLIELMRQLNKNLKITFIFSTHDQMVMERADRLLRLHDGKLETTL